MSKAAKSRTPMSAKSKGLICLVILLALTVFVSCLSIAGMNLDSEGVNVLLPWVPVSSGNWPKSLPLIRDLDGGSYYEFNAALPAGSEGDLHTEIENAAAVVKNRLSHMGENDALVTAKDDGIRLEIRNMPASRLSSVMNMAIMAGQFEFLSGGEAVLTEKDIQSASLGLNSSRTGYNLVIKTTKEGADTLAAANISYVSITCDGESISSYASVSGDTITASMGTTSSGYNTGANMAFLLNTGAVDVNLTQRDNGTVSASSASIKTIVLIIGAALLAFALVYLLMNGKLTGCAGFLTVWCAVVLTLFFEATIVVPSSSVTALNIGSLVAVLLGILLAIYTAVARTEAISAQIAQGSAPKQAVKFGLKAAAKNVWCVHAVVLAISLLLMIFPFSRATGYSLAAGVAGSAITACLMRAFLACFIRINGKASLYGKTK